MGYAGHSRIHIGYALQDPVRLGFLTPDLPRQEVVKIGMAN